MNFTIDLDCYICGILLYINIITINEFTLSLSSFTLSVGVVLQSTACNKFLSVLIPARRKICMRFSWRNNRGKSLSFRARHRWFFALLWLYFVVSPFLFLVIRLSFFFPWTGFPCGSAEVWFRVLGSWFVSAIPFSLEVSYWWSEIWLRCDQFFCLKKSRILIFGAFWSREM